MPPPASSTCWSTPARTGTTSSTACSSRRWACGCPTTCSTWTCRRWAPRSATSCARPRRCWPPSGPDAFLVLGDTNSALSLIMAKRMQIPTYHMEAGNRCFDANVPEETNRRLVDHTADFNLAYTEHARRNLLAEGLHPRRVIVTGSPMNEVLGLYREAIGASGALGDAGRDRRGVLPGLGAPRGERRPPRAAGAAGRLAERGGRGVGLAGAGLHPPAHAQAAGGRWRGPGGARRWSASTSRSGSWTTTGCSWARRACCRTPARSARSPRCWASRP